MPNLKNMKRFNFIEDSFEIELIGVSDESMSADDRFLRVTDLVAKITKSGMKKNRHDRKNESYKDAA